MAYNMKTAKGLVTQYSYMNKLLIRYSQTVHVFYHPVYTTYKYIVLHIVTPVLLGGKVWNYVTK